MTRNQKNQLREQAKEMIRDFFKREYGDWSENYINPWRIRLAYILSAYELTYTEIAVNLMDCRINTYLGDEGIHIRQINFRDIEDLVNALPAILNFKKFEELADVSQEEEEELDRRLFDAFERSMHSDTWQPLEVKCLEENWTK